MVDRSQGRKKSNFPALAAIPADATLDFVSGGTNFKISLANFLAALNVTGTIVQDGAVAGTPVLDVAGTINNIRNLENGSGVLASVSPENGITLEHNFALNAIGAPLSADFTVAQPIFRSLVAGSGMNVSASGDIIQISASATPISTKTVVVNEIGDLPAAVGDVITLLGDTHYVFTNDISLGNIRFVVGDKTYIDAADSSVITLTYTGTGNMFTIVDKTFRIGRITLSCANGSLLAAADSTNTKILQLIDLTVSECDKIGNVSGFLAIQLNNIAFSAVTTSGITVTGNSGILFILSCLVVMTDGAFIDFNGFTVSSITLDINDFVLVAATSHALTGTGSTNIVNIGTMVNCRKSGAGTLLNGIATEDDKWQFQLNDEIRDTRTDALLSISGNATETVIASANTPVLVAGTWDASEAASQFTIDAAGRATFTGVKDTRLPISISTTAEMASGSTKSITLYVAINGAIVAESGAQNDISTISGRTSLLWQHTFTVALGDFVELWVENNSDTINIVITDSVLRVN